MTRHDEDVAAQRLSQALGISFKGSKHKLDSWGEADDWTILPDGRLLLLEVETNQKHPNTNVLKVWPYLEAHPDTSILLVQVFFPRSPGLRSSRGRLCTWLGDRLQGQYPHRFRYHQLVIDEHSIEGLDELKATIG